MANKYLSKINFEGTEYLIKDAENRTELSNFQDDVYSSLSYIHEELELLELVDNIIISALLIKDGFLGQNIGTFYYSEDFNLPSSDNPITPIPVSALMQLVINKVAPYLLLWDVEEIDEDTDDIISINGATIAPIISHMPADFDDNLQGKIYCRLNDDEIVEIILDLSSENKTTFTWQKHSVTEKIDLAKAETVEELTTVLNNTINEEISPLTTKLDYTNIAYGTCATAADVATKEVALNSNVANHWKQEIGSMIAIKFDISNSASNVKIKVGNNDAYPIWYNNEEYTSTGTAYTGYTNRLIVYMFNGTHWVWITSSYDSNTTYTNEKLGNGYGTCSTAASTTAKTATFSSYTLVKHGMVSIKFTNAVPANATLNINSKGAKNIYYRGAKIIANIIKAGDIATFVYDGTQYQLIAIDRWQNDIDTLTTNLNQLSNIVDTKAPLDSPTFIGNPTAPTPAVTDNDTSIATTAFVQAAINNTLKVTQTLNFKGVISSTYPQPPDGSGFEDEYFPQLKLPKNCSIGEVYIAGCQGFCGHESCEIGDLIICYKEGSALNYDYPSQIKQYWTVVQTNINGAVTGPATSTNDNIAIFNGTTGTLIKDSGISKTTLSNALNVINDHEERLDDLDSLKRSDYVYTTANQALTNKTYNGYTLKDAAGRGVDSTPTINSNNLVESGALYTKFTAIDNHFDEVETKTISTTANDDDVVVLSGSGGVYSVSYTASHASQGPTNGYTSGNTTTSITSSGTIKIPQIKVNKYGHVTEASDESVTITMPTVPTGFTITPTLTDDNVIDLTGSAKTNGFSLDAKHAKKGPSSGYTSGNSTTSISGYGDSKTIKIPQITVDAYGHVTAAADESVTITMPSAQTLPRTFSIKNTSVAASSWVSSTRNSIYPYQATVNVSNLTENYIVAPRYNNMDLIKYIISPETLSNTGNITIYAKNKPTVAITIPEINCYQTN